MFLVLASLTIAANAAVIASGSCGITGNNGDDVTYALYDDGTFVISGNGKMMDYGIGGPPWYDVDIRSKITKVEIGYGVTTIGMAAFPDCTNLISVTIPNSVTRIGVSAFNGCSSLPSVTIPNSVTSIGDAAFFRCRGLKSVIIGSSVTSIEEDAFANCPFVESLYCLATEPPSAQSLPYSSQPDRTTIYVPSGSLEAYKSTAPWSSYTKIVALPTLVSSISVTASCNEIRVGEKATLTATVLPGNAAKKTVTWSSSDTNVATVDATTGEVTAVSAGTATITATATDVSGVTGTCVVTVKEAHAVSPGIIHIGKNGGDNVIYEIYDDGTLVISGQGEMGDFPCPLTRLDGSYFDKVRIEYGVTNIGAKMFSGNNLVSVTIPNTVTSIGEYAFYGCSALSSVTVPNSVTTIGVGAFNGCKDLASLQVETSNMNYCSEDNVLFNKDKTELICCAGAKSGEYVIPNSVTSIGNEAFAGCSGLTSVTIPNAVKSIGYDVFYNCIYEA